MAPRPACIALVLGLLATTGASATAITIGYRPRTGDAWIDTHLADVNRYGRSDRDQFIDDVVAAFGAPRYFVRDLLLTRRWEPADVYYACALAHRLNQPCVDIVRDYGDDRGEGWGAIARRMGVSPGSAEFQALKGELVRVEETHRARSARPARPAPLPVPDRVGGAQGDDRGKGKSGNPATDGKGRKRP